MTPTEALQFWYSRIDYERRTPQPGDLKLDRMRALLDRLGNPHHRLRIVHVAGSKGKGSTAAMLAAVLRQAGYRVGLFTSPHLVRVEERFQVDGQPISAPELTQALTEVHAATGGGLEPTFFEVATAVGFLHFVRRRVDAAVLEVGLGGRFDSTNVCRPAVTVITSISFDHTQQLGDRLASIAREKAGIVKLRVPCISGATEPEARAVIETVCCQRQAPLRQLEVDLLYRYTPGRVTADETEPARVAVETVSPAGRRQWPTMALGLLGKHQAANAALVVACVEELRHQGWHLPDIAVAAGLAGVEWPARMEVVGRRPLVVLDCAHNVASAHALVETLTESFPPAPSARRYLVLAVSNDKNVAGILRELGPHFAHAFLTRYGNNPRSVAPEEMAELLRREGPWPCSTHPRAADALAAALDLATPDDLVCVTGSVFLAGELRPVLVARDVPILATAQP